jgi:SAM-dependent methyltransferase
VLAVEWGRGRYERIADQVLPAAEAVVERAAPSGGERVVDLGCGTGNAALLAAERGASVTGVDPAQRLLDVATAEAAERGLDVTLELGDASSIPVPDATVDALISVFGVIFAPDVRAAAAEIDRVIAPEGRVVLSAWIPEGALFAAIRERRELMTKLTGESAGPRPFPWHEQEALEELFARFGFSVSIEERTLAFEAPSAQAFAEGEFEHHPMWVAVREKLEPEQAEQLRDRGLVIYQEANEDPSGFRLTSRYAVVQLTR